MKKLLLLFLAIVPASMSAQLLYNYLDNNTNGVLFQNKVPGASLDGSVKGSPYQEAKFLPANVSGVSGIVLSRYNINTDQIEVKMSGEESDIYILPKQAEYGRITFTASHYSLVLASYTNPEGERTTGYLVKIHEAGNIGLYRQDRVTFRKGKAAASSYDSPTPDSWEKQPGRYYMTVSDGRIVPAPKNAKELTSIYPADKTEAIRSFLKKNGYSFKKEEDLVQIISFLATL